MFEGTLTALVTPFRDGKLDVERLQQQVEFQVEAGTTCVCPVGTTGGGGKDCGCNAGPGSDAGFPAVLILGLLLWARRRM